MMDISKIKDDSVIYVRNKLDGAVILTLYDGNRVESVVLPKTFIPIRATDFAPPRLFRNSSDFRKAIARGNIELIPQDEAERELQTEEAIAELERLRKEYQMVSGIQQDLSTLAKTLTTETEQKVSDKVRDVLLRTDISETDKYAILVGEWKKRKITQADLKFIASSSEKGSKLFEWASNLLKKGGKKSG